MAKKKNKMNTTAAPNDLKGLYQQIERKFGAGAIIPLGEHFKVSCDAIPSGSISIDYIMGVGGWPRGRICEISGVESSGKTTLALQAIAMAQKDGLVAAFIDAEHALDINYAKRIGVDISKLLLSQPDSGDQALQIAEMMIGSGQIALIVIDSVAALVPREELDGELSDQQIGAQARLMSKFFRRNVSTAKSSNTCVLFINQIRTKIGSFMGSPETTPGGRALKFYASMRLDIRRIGQVKQGDTIIGHKARIKVIKNKVAIPFRVCDVDIIYGQGVSKAMDILNLGLRYNFIEKSGSWFSYGSTKLGLGAATAMEFLLEHDDVANELESKIRQELFKTEEVSIAESETENDDAE